MYPVTLLSYSYYSVFYYAFKYVTNNRCFVLLVSILILSISVTVKLQKWFISISLHFGQILTSFLMFLLIILYLKISGNKYYKILNNRKLMVQCIHEPQKSVLKFQVKEFLQGLVLLSNQINQIISYNKIMASRLDRQSYQDI